MTNTETVISHQGSPSIAAPPARRWTNYIGAWLGIGTSPGALLIGAQLAARHEGAIPLPTLLISLILMFTVIWFQGMLGVAPPVGDGTNLSGITRRYFGAGMQRVLGGVIAIAMIGWFGFNVGLGGAALSALLKIPTWIGPLILGVPTLILSLTGLRSWNGLATLATVAVVLLVVLVVVRLAAPVIPLDAAPGPARLIPLDMAIFLGYVSVFSIRAPDFSANLSSRRDLAPLSVLLIVPLMLVTLAGAILYSGTGSTDLVAVLAAPGGLAIGNLLVTVAVVAPTFTTMYSGAPGLKAAFGLDENTGMIIVAVIGLTLAVLRFDLWLLSWLSLLSASLPPLIIPLAVESTVRRRGGSEHRIPLLAWLPGSVFSVALTVIKHPLALLVGLGVSALGTIIWRITLGSSSSNASQG